MRSRLHCRAADCRAEILFVPLTGRPGRQACLDASPVDPAAAAHRSRLVRLFQSADGLTAVLASGAYLDAAIADGVALFTFHSETCLSGRHRRPMPDRLRAERAAAPTSPGATS